MSPAAISSTCSRRSAYMRTNGANPLHFALAGVVDPAAGTNRARIDAKVSQAPHIGIRLNLENESRQVRIVLGRTLDAVTAVSALERSHRVAQQSSAAHPTAKASNQRSHPKAAARPCCAKKSHTAQERAVRQSSRAGEQPQSARAESRHPPSTFRRCRRPVRKAPPAKPPGIRQPRRQIPPESGHRQPLCPVIGIGDGTHVHQIDGADKGLFSCQGESDSNGDGGLDRWI